MISIPSLKKLPDIYPIRQLELILICIMMGLIQTALSQGNIDSLKTELNQANGKRRVDVLNQLASESKHSDPQQALQYTEEAIDLANKLSYVEGEAVAYLNYGNLHRKLGKFNETVDAYLTALHLSQSSNHTNNIAKSYNGLGIVYNMMGDYDKSLEAFLSALRTYEESNDSIGKADALNNIGIHHYYLGNANEALDYYKQALEIRRKVGSMRDIAASLNNIGDVYSDLGDNGSALQYFLETLKIQEEYGSKDVQFALNINIGLLYTDLKRHTKAMEHYQKGLAIADTIGDNWGLATTLNYIGLAYLKTGNYIQAEQFFNQSLELANKIEAKAIIKEAYLNLANLYTAREDYRKSLEYYKLYTEVKDSIFNETTSKQMAEIRTRYETEKKEAAIHELTSEKTVQDLKLKKSETAKWSFIVVSILVFLLASVVFYGFRQKQKANTLLKERNRLEIENKNRAISLFGQQVSKEVASELLSSTSKESSKKLYACVMFLDIRNFTPFAESKEPFEIIQYQNDVFGFMIEVISKHHGIINLFLGDGFMATFGAPASSGNDCQNAVDAAREIVELLNEKCESGQLPDTHVGIGLHAGYVVAGNVGTAERKQYTVTGNTVILASRIEQLNKKFNSSILISLEVLNRIDHSGLKMENIGLKKLKGRAEPMELVRLA